MSIQPSVKVLSLVKQMQALAPLSMAESWDQVGLQWGREEWPVEKAMLCIDLTEPVMQEAIEKNVNFIVSYHPPMFSALKRITESNWKARLALAAIENRIAVYSPHTALDSVYGGVNDWLASVVGGSDLHKVSAIKPLEPLTDHEVLKLVTFVPEKDVDSVRQAVAEAGAGVIGAYSECSFSLAGEGSFKGNEGSNPAVGQAGQLEKVAEIRLEMVVKQSLVTLAVKALKAAHPYEEVAYDLYPLKRINALAAGEEEHNQVHDQIHGTGRQVQFDSPLSLRELSNRISGGLWEHEGAGMNLKPWQRLAVIPPIDQQTADLDGVKVSSVGICAGAGYSVLAKCRADVIFTGEMRHHDQLDLAQTGKWAILAGHTETERPFLEVLRKRLMEMQENQSQENAVSWLLSEVEQGVMKEI